MLSPLVGVVVLAGAAFTLGLRWWERNPVAGRGGEPWLAMTMVLSLVFADLGLHAAIAGNTGLVAAVSLAALFLAPWTLVSAVAVPLGAWRAAAALGGVSGWAWNGDVRRAQLVAAASALSRRPNERGVRWVNARLAGDVSAGAVVARAALAAARGDTSRAAELARIALDFEGAELPTAARQVAAPLANPHGEQVGLGPLQALARKWERLAAGHSRPTRAALTAALEELCSDTGTEAATLAAHAPRLIGYRRGDAWALACDDLERRLDRTDPLDPEAELHRWTRLRRTIENAGGGQNPAVWLRCERLLQRFAVRLHRSAEGGPLAIAVLRWVRGQAWAIGDPRAADIAHSNLALAGG